MTKARIKTPKIFCNLSKSEIKKIIENNIFNEKMRMIAIRYYVYEECMIDIAINYNLCRQSISKILKEIAKEIEKVA